MGRFYRMLWWIRYSWARLIGLVRNKATNNVILGSLFTITADSRIEGSLVETTSPLIGQSLGAAKNGDPEKANRRSEGPDVANSIHQVVGARNQAVHEGNHGYSKTQVESHGSYALSRNCHC